MVYLGTFRICLGHSLLHPWTNSQLEQGSFYLACGLYIPYCLNQYRWQILVLDCLTDPWTKISMDHSVLVKKANRMKWFYLAAFRLSCKLSDFFDFHLNNLSVALLLSSFSTDSLRFASLLENKFLKDFLVEKLFFAMAKLLNDHCRTTRMTLVKVYYDVEGRWRTYCSLVHSQTLRSLTNRCSGCACQS